MMMTRVIEERRFEQVTSFNRTQIEKQSRCSLVLTCWLHYWDWTSQLVTILDITRSFPPLLHRLPPRCRLQFLLLLPPPPLPLLLLLEFISWCLVWSSTERRTNNETRGLIQWHWLWSCCDSIPEYFRDSIPMFVPPYRQLVAGWWKSFSWSLTRYSFILLADEQEPEREPEEKK